MTFYLNISFFWDYIGNIVGQIGEFNKTKSLNIWELIGTILGILWDYDGTESRNLPTRNSLGMSWE